MDMDKGNSFYQQTIKVWQFFYNRWQESGEEKDRIKFLYWVERRKRATAIRNAQVKHFTPEQLAEIHKYLSK